LEIGPDGVLEWLPQESILFDGAKLRLKTRVDLHQRAQFLGWELYCLGRPAIDERFENGSADLALELYRGGRPLLLERLSIADDTALPGAAGLRGHPIGGTFIASGADARALDCVRSLLGDRARVLSGATLLEDVLVVRCLGNGGEPVQRLFREIWALLRPQLLGRPPSAPRIWAT
jgi:urease accessory protein